MAPERCAADLSRLTVGMRDGHRCRPRLYDRVICHFTPLPLRGQSTKDGNAPTDATAGVGSPKGRQAEPDRCPRRYPREAAPQHAWPKPGKARGAIGLTFQQVQKYERGANRIGAGRLHDLSQVLDVPVSFFFDDMDPVRAPAIPAGFAEPAAEAFDADPLRRRETVELVSAYYRIDDPALRRRLFELARALAVRAERPEAK